MVDTTTSSGQNEASVVEEQVRRPLDELNLSSEVWDVSL